MSTFGKFRSLRRLRNSVEEDRLHRNNEMARLQAIPRYQRTETDLLGEPFRLVDSASFLSSYREIFEEEIYRFHSRSNNPLIFDCGTNIGVAEIDWIQLYPL